MMPALNFMYRLFCKFPKFARVSVSKTVNLFFKIRLHSIKTPAFIIFFVTDRCNAHCKHCFYRAGLNRNSDELGLEEIGKMAVSLRNDNFLLITGGEPFLRDDLFEICRAFYSHGRTKKIRIVTNGYFTDRILSVSERILQDKIDLTIQTSLDALGDKHDELRGLNGLFTKATETVARLNILKRRYPKLKLSIITTITKANYDEVSGLSKYIREKFDRDVDLALVRERGVGIYNLDDKYNTAQSVLEDDFKLPDYDALKNILIRRYGLSESRRCNFIRDFETLEKKMELDIIFKAKRPPVKCLAGITDAVVYPNGAVSLCEITKPFGNLRDYGYDLRRMWDSDEKRYAMERIKDCFCMHPCHLISAMKHSANTLLHIGEGI